MGKEQIEKYFENILPEQVYLNLKESIFTALGKKVGKTFEFDDVNQMVFAEDSCVGYMEEKDGKIYPIAKLEITINSKDFKKHRNFIVTVTPFQCYIHGVKKEFSDYGSIDKGLTNSLRLIMKNEFGLEYTKLLRNYTYRVNSIEGLKV